jgi:nicotinate phosphoribosyltransferase
LALEEEDPMRNERLALRHPSDHTKYRTLPSSAIARSEPLLVEVLRGGKLVYDLPPLEAIRQQRVADMEALDPGIRRLVNPHIYHVSLSEKLWGLKQELIEAAMKENT